MASWESGMSFTAACHCGRCSSFSRHDYHEHVLFTSNTLSNLLQNRKDVTITYTPITPDAPSTTPSDEPLRFNDIVQYRSSKHSSTDTAPSKVEGIDTLLPPPKGAPEGYSPAASYQWRGKVCVCHDVISESQWNSPYGLPMIPFRVG